MFFRNLEELILCRGEAIPSQNIWNLDEAGMSAVRKPKRDLCKIEMKHRVASAELGALPPVLFFQEFIF